jgi:hypothetical protein
VSDERLRALRAQAAFRVRAATEYARRRYSADDLTPATIAAFQVQLEEDAARGDQAAIDLREELLTRAIERVVENPAWL